MVDELLDYDVGILLYLFIWGGGGGGGGGEGVVRGGVPSHLLASPTSSIEDRMDGGEGGGGGRQEGWRGGVRVRRRGGCGGGGCGGGEGEGVEGGGGREGEEGKPGEMIYLLSTHTADCRKSRHFTPPFGFHSRLVLKLERCRAIDNGWLKSASISESAEFKFFELVVVATSSCTTCSR